MSMVGIVNVQGTQTFGTISPGAVQIGPYSNPMSSVALIQEATIATGASSTFTGNSANLGVIVETIAVTATPTLTLKGASGDTGISITTAPGQCCELSLPGTGTPSIVLTCGGAAASIQVKVTWF